MKIEINIEKKHLIFFGMFIILISSIYVLADYQVFGHSANEVGPGMMTGPISINQYDNDGRALYVYSSSQDAIAGKSIVEGKSAIYGWALNGAFSGFFDGGEVVIHDNKLMFSNENFLPINYRGDNPYIKMDNLGNLIFKDAILTSEVTLSDLAAGGGTSSFWNSCTGGIYYGAKVGIGRDNPAELLDVAGNVRITGDIKLDESIINDNIILEQSTGKYLTIIDRNDNTYYIPLYEIVPPASFSYEVDYDCWSVYYDPWGQYIEHWSTTITLAGGSGNYEFCIDNSPPFACSPNTEYTGPIYTEGNEVSSPEKFVVLEDVGGDVIELYIGIEYGC